MDIFTIARVDAGLLGVDINARQGFQFSFERGDLAGFEGVLDPFDLRFDRFEVCLGLAMELGIAVFLLIIKKGKVGLHDGGDKRQRFILRPLGFAQEYRCSTAHWGGQGCHLHDSVE